MKLTERKKSVSVCESDITAGSWFKQGETGKSVPNVYGESDSLSVSCVWMLQLGAAVPFRKRVPYFVTLEGLWSAYTHHDRLCVCIARLWLLSFLYSVRNWTSVYVRVWAGRGRKVIVLWKNGCQNVCVCRRREQEGGLTSASICPRLAVNS